MPDVAGLAAHVGPGHEHGAHGVVGEGDVVGNIRVKEELLDHGVAAFFDVDDGFRCELGLDVAGLVGDCGQGEDAVESGQRLYAVAEFLVFVGDLLQEAFERLVAFRRERLFVLIPLAEHLDNLWCMEAMNLLGAA